MATENSHASTQSDSRLASVSGWVTRAPVIPLLTGLCFVASTVLAYVWSDLGNDYGDDLIFLAVPMAIVCFILGLALGFPLRQNIVRIRDNSEFGQGIMALILVGIIWVLAFLVQFVFLAVCYLSMAF